MLILFFQDAVPRSEQPWWKSYVPSKPLMFLVLWPFIVNIVFYYFRRRKVSCWDKHSKTERQQQTYISLPIQSLHQSCDLFVLLLGSTSSGQKLLTFSLPRSKSEFSQCSYISLLASPENLVLHPNNIS